MYLIRFEYLKNSITTHAFADDDIEDDLHFDPFWCEVFSEDGCDVYHSVYTFREGYKQSPGSLPLAVCTRFHGQLFKTYASRSALIEQIFKKICFMPKLLLD